MSYFPVMNLPRLMTDLSLITASCERPSGTAMSKSTTKKLWCIFKLFAQLPSAE